MKKRFAIFLAILILVSTFAGCAASGNFSNESISDASGGAAYDYDPVDNAAAAEDALGTADFAGPDVLAGGEPGALNGEKMIYTSYAEIETKEFDASLEALSALIARYGGFIEDSYVSGTAYSAEYYGYRSYRYAEYTIRVPVDVFKSVQEDLSALGNVVSLTTNAENVTTQYTDMESRLKTYRTEEARLLELLEKAENVSDIITIEDRLSSVRYEIEYLTTSLNNLDNRVSYSTVRISLNEVERLTQKVETQQSYGEQIVTGLKRTLQSIGNFFKDLLKWLIINIPYWIVPVVLIVLLVRVIRRKWKKWTAKPESGKTEGK